MIKKSLFGYFSTGFFKNYCPIWNQYSRICLIAKFCEETKMAKFWTKKCLIWVFLTKDSLIGNFWARVLTKLLSYLKSASSNLSISNISWKKMPKFGTKNAWFGYFWARVLENYCHNWNQQLRICLIAKFWEEGKKPKFGTKNALFGCFQARNLKDYCHIWNSTVKFFKNEPLTCTVNFGIGSAFSKGPASAFSEGPGPGLGPLYKVCHFSEHLFFSSLHGG